MSRDGTGAYNLPNPAVVTGTPISSADYNATMADMAAALTDSLARDGQGAMQAPLAMGGNRITNVGAPTVATDAVNRAYVDAMFSGFRNLIINGNPTINQRGYVSGSAVPVANNYTLDRWRVVAAGQAASWTDSAGIRTVVAPPGGMEQIVEAANVPAGLYTMSWVGPATATINGFTVANGGQVTLTGGVNQVVRMSAGAWSRLQLERGGVATPFEWRPVAVEQSMCERYFETSSPNLVNGGGAWSLNSGVSEGIAHPTGTYRQNIRFRSLKRGTPVVVASNTAGTAGQVMYFTTVWNSNGFLTIGFSSATGFFVGHDIASSVETQFVWTASAEF